MHLFAHKSPRGALRIFSFSLCSGGRDGDTCAPGDRSAEPKGFPCRTRTRAHANTRARSAGDGPRVPSVAAPSRPSVSPGPSAVASGRLVGVTMSPHRLLHEAAAVGPAAAAVQHETCSVGTRGHAGTRGHTLALGTHWVGGPAAPRDGGTPPNSPLRVVAEGQRDRPDPSWVSPSLSLSSSSLALRSCGQDAACQRTRVCHMCVRAHACALCACARATVAP